MRDVANEFSLDVLKLWNLGYVNGHLLYLTPTNLRGEMPPLPGIKQPPPTEAYTDIAITNIKGG